MAEAGAEAGAEARHGGGKWAVGKGNVSDEDHRGRASEEGGCGVDDRRERRGRPVEVSDGVAVGGGDCRCRELVKVGVDDWRVLGRTHWVETPELWVVDAVSAHFVSRYFWWSPPAQPARTLDQFASTGHAAGVEVVDFCFCVVVRTNYQQSSLDHHRRFRQHGTIEADGLSDC